MEDRVRLANKVQEWETLRLEHDHLIEASRAGETQAAADKEQIRLLLHQLNELTDQLSNAQNERLALINEISDLRQSNQTLQQLLDQQANDQQANTQAGGTTPSAPDANQEGNFLLSRYDWTEKALSSDGKTWQRVDRNMADIFSSMVNAYTSQGFYCLYKNHPGELNKLFDYHGSDKGSNSLEAMFPFGHKPHTYGDLYELFFSVRKDENINLLECGIGSTTDTVPSNMGKSYKPGASLRSWRDYFHNANIYGVDIDPACIINEDRISSCQADQLSSESIQNALENFDNPVFDIVIDDGLHTAEACISLYKNMRAHLKANATYIIEDMTPASLLEVAEFFGKENINYIIFGGVRKYATKPEEPPIRLDDNFLLLINHKQHS